MVTVTTELKNGTVAAHRLQAKSQTLQNGVRFP